MLLAAAIALTLSGAPVADTLRASVISSARQAGELAWPAASIVVPQRITREEIGTVVSLPDAIRRFAGVQVRDYGGVGGLKTVNVRSLGSEHTGVFIDGLQVDNAQNMQVDLGRFGTDNLRSISLFSGQKASALQGAKEYSPANAIYLETAEPEFRPGRRDNLRLGVRTGSFRTFSPALTWEHLTRRGNRLRFAGEAVDSEGGYRFHVSDFRQYPDGSLLGYDTTMVRKNCDLRSVRAEGFLSGPASGKADWNVHGYFYDSERGLPGPVYKKAGKYPLSEDRQKDRDAFLQGRYGITIGDRWSFMGKAKASCSHLEYVDVPELRTDLAAAHFNYRNHSAYVSGAASAKLGGALRVSLAQDVQYDYLDADLRDFVYPGRLSSWSAATAMVHRGGLDLSVTVLYLRVHDNFLDGAVRKTARRDALMPSVVADWRLSDRLSLNGFAKRSYRMPTFNDLYYSTVGSKTLDPEDAIQFDLGVVWQPWSGMTLKADLYHNRLKNKIIAVPTSNQFRWSMYNLGKVRVLGADVVADGRTKAGRAYLGATLRYTYQRSRDRSLPPGAEPADVLTWNGQIPYIPLHSGSAGIFSEYRGWRLDVTAFAMGERYTTSANLPAYRLGPWATLDATASKSFDLRGGILALRLSLDNLLDEHYEIVDNYPMPGFWALLKAEYSF